MSPRKVLVIEDEVAIRRLLKASLDPAEYTLIEADTGGQGIQLAAAQNPSVVLLDLGLPDTDGVEVAKAIRGWSQMPIIVLSARGQEEDKIAALDAGADDYLTKPFSVGELLARMRVALRRGSGSPAEPVFESHPLKIDFSSREVFRNGELVHLTPNEYDLLALLARNAGRVLTHRQLLVEVWGPQNAEDTHYLRVYMGQLRHKLEDDPSRPTLIINEPGVGYRLRTKS